MDQVTISVTDSTPYGVGSGVRFVRPRLWWQGLLHWANPRWYANPIFCVTKIVSDTQITIMRADA